MFSLFYYGAMIQIHRKAKRRVTLTMVLFYKGVTPIEQQMLDCQLELGIYSSPVQTQRLNPCSEEFFFIENNINLNLRILPKISLIKYYDNVIPTGY